MKKQNWEAKQGKDSTHMCGRARICVLHQVKPTPKQLCHARAWQPSPSSARISVENHAYAWWISKLTQDPHICVTLTSSSLNHPRIGVEDPRICVEGILAASNHA
ncbi:hypothetical protein PIB30_105308 [Stylosanthes scabra]|uniref:Uncharacterized protein n=1 Tax=Stylosanthes scabra TaxID=79078 RepID=A0ABU6V1C1_9FABA|nr:hypothetical protein [Stylosanthes scabra]